MRLRRLSLKGFRNLADGVLELPREGMAVLGDNAQGKSNLLEAVYYLETFRSFRGTRDDHLVRFGEDVFRLVGSLEPGDSEPPLPEGQAELEVAGAYARSSRSKKVTVAGDEVERLGDGVGRLGAVIFTPADLRLVTDGPQERRRFLNVLLSLNDPEYLTSLQRFRQVLSQRNAALREGAGPPSVDAWNAVLVRSGSRVTAARARWLLESVAHFVEYYQGVSGGSVARLRYEPGIPETGEETELGRVEEAYYRALESTRERERRRGTTVVGPHRDEFRIFLEAPGGERDLREYGSGGQCRTAALALRLLETDAVRARRGLEPLLLLDDVFAELDEGRSRRVLELLDRMAAGQVILTAPKEGDVRFRGDRLPRWTVREGEIRT